MNSKICSNEYTVYVLQCADDSLYCGITNDLESRLAVHESGKGSKYVRSHLPFTLVYAEDGFTKSEALRFELKFKSLTRAQKLKLLNIKKHEK